MAVRVTDQDGATAEATRRVTVANRLPAPVVALPLLVLAGKPAQLTGQPSSDPDGAVVAYRWDLDGAAGFEVDAGATPTVVRAWAAPGPYPVVLEVTDDSGGRATTTVTVVVKSPPSASLSAAAPEVATGETVSLSAAASTDPDGEIALYAWDLDGDGVFERSTGTTPTATTSFAQTGTATLRVRVTDDDGLASIAATTITVRAPVASPGGDGDDDPGGESTTPPGDATAGDDTTTAGGSGDDAAGDGDAGVLEGGATGRAAGTPAGGPGATPATPRTAAPGANAATAPALDGSPVQRLKAIVRSGLRIACRAEAGTRCTVRVEVDRRTARRLRLGRTTRLGGTTLNAAASGTVAVRLSARARRALARVRSVRLLVKATATTADGSSTPLTRIVLGRR